MRHRKIVPCLNAQPISQFIGNGNSALSLADCIRDWQPAGAEEPLRALINAFGAAGSGGHILLESCPAGAAATEYKSAINNRTQTLVVLSAASESQLRTLAVNLLNRLSSEENFSQEHISLQSLAYTLSVGRIELVERLALLVDGISTLRNLLNKFVESSGSVSDDKVFRGRFLETYQPSPRSASIESVTEETLRAFAQKWVRGEVDLRPLTTYLEPRGGRRQSLPTYPFAQEKHWLTTTVENNAVPKPHVNPIFKSQTGQTPVNNHQSLVTLTERYLLQTFSKVSGIPEEHLYPAAPLKNYGINSLMITQLNTLLTQALGDTVSKTLFFEQLNLQGVALQLVHSHTEALEQWLRLQGGSDAERNNERNSAGADRLNDPAPLTSRWGPLPNTDETSPRSEPAIIGLAGRYPKSETLAEFWDNLRAGRDCIAVIPEERWPLEGFYLPGQPIAGKSYNKWGGFLRNVDKFDALFFGIAPSVADLMDPQARLFLETAWETIEDAGYNRTELQNAYAGRVGVFAGVMYGDYQLYHGYITDDKTEQRTAVEGRVSYGSIAHQVSYALDLCGPSMAVDTMCSSSLTAIHLAAQSIQNGECLAAIVGGVNLSIHPGKFILQAQLGMSSTSGRCKSFGAGGDGFVPGEGVGAIFLKPYTRAQQDGDHIYGVIKATSINAGGETNGYTVPNPRAQAELVSTALGRAGIHPAAVSYIEAHGTGTALGDPIEITGLTQAFTSNAWESGQWSGKQRYCAIGSVKSNIGHCESAAGIAGVTKVLLQMKYRQLVPNLHTEQLNPNIDFGATPFKVQQTLQEWRRPILTINGEEKEFPRIAGVSSFGAGGANAHIIIAEHIAAATDLTQTVASEADPVIVILSARSAEQLKEQAIRLRKAIETENLSDRQLRDIAYTLQTGREAFEERLGLVVANIQALFAGLTDFIEDMPADNIYRGNTTKGENYLDLISSDDELQAGIARWVEKGLYDKLLRLWVKGLNFPWQRLYNDPENKPERISLPTYPFARESHWLPSAAPFRSVTGAAPLPGREYKTLWFSPEWHEVEIAAPAEKIMAVSKGGHRVFIIGDFQQSLVDALEKELPSVHCHWLQCFESDLSRRYEFYVTELIEHLQEILRTRPVDPLTVQVLLIADGREDDPSLCFSGVAGVLKSAARENPKLITQCIELDAAVTPEQVPGILLSNAAARYSDYHSANTKLEHFYQASDQYVRYCRGVRRLIRFVRCSLNTTTDAMLSPWRDKGVYLITGGTGGLGLIFAKAIAADSKGATLLLTGRREGNRATQALVDSLTALGAKAHYYRLDVSRREAVENFVDDTLRTFGKITGVLHCAGVIRDSSLIRKTRAEIQAVLAPKVAGLIHLDEAIGNHPLDFLLLFSSTSAMGNAGQADYAAANAFMDAYAHYRNARVSQGQRQGGTLSVNWPLWAEGGMQAGEAARIQMARSGLRPLDTGAGLEAAYFALNHAVTQLTVWCCDPVAAASAFHTVDTLPAAQPIAAAAPSSLTGLKEKTLQNLKAMLAGTISLSESRIDIGERWSAYGIDSIIINTLNRKLESVLGKIPQTLFYEYGTLNALAGFLAETYPRACSRWTHKRETAQIAPRQWEVRTTAGRDTVPGESDTGIAITGLSGRYAQANTPDEFWHNLKTGKNCIAEIPAERWPLRDFYLEDGQQAIIQGKSYSKWGGFIEGYADFDPLFFNMTPRDAELIDPQERLFLQVCHTALEDAGYVPSAFSEQLRQRTAVFGGVTRQGFNLHGRELAARFPATSFGSLVNRVSYFYDFKGPSVPVDTMCSSALVAIHLGCEYIRDGKGDLAIAGGVNLYSHPVNYIEACAAGLLAPGRTATVFGNGGEGFVPGEGAGAVVLKSLSRAIGDGDGIYAVIKGSAINHGGKTNSYSTPSPQQQAAVIQQALAQAGIDPRSISYIEAAANGSAVGDAIEVAALQKVFGGRKNVQGNYAIGSVKPNIGHCESAAGISQLTKVIYSLLDRSLPPTLSAIEQGDPVELPFQVQREFSHWNSVSVDGQPVLRRAGITGVGAGGVNAHIIVEEFLQQDAVQERILSRHLFVLSAQNRERLQEYAEKWLSYLQQQEAVDLTRIVYTLQTGREAMPCRLALVVADKGELEHKLAGWLKSSAGSVCHYGELIHGAAGLADAADSGRFDKYLHQDELDKLAHLWTQGVSISWHRLYGNRSIIKHTRLPTYPFKRQKCWPSIPSWKQDRQTASKAVEYYTLGALAVPEAFFEDYLTFCPFEEKIHGFSMSRVFLNPTRYPEEWNLLRQKQTELRQVLFYKEDFQRIQTVLDFGCGHGTDVIQIARLYPHIRVHGYTITAAQAELGNKRIAQLQLNDRTTIFHRDSAADSFPSRYDLVIGIEVSFHIRDKRGLFANIARSLNDNSRVLLMDYTANLRGPIVDPHLDISIPTDSQWCELLAGNQLVIDEAIDVSWQIANFLHDPDVGQNTEHLPDVVQKTFKNFANQSLSLEKGWISYCLFKLRKDGTQNSAAIATINAGKLANKIPYTDALRDMLRAGSFPYPPAESFTTHAPGQGIHQHLVALLQRVLGHKKTDIEAAETLSALGIGSVNAVELMEEINTAFHLALPTSVLFECDTLNELVRVVADNGGMEPGRVQDSRQEFIPDAYPKAAAPEGIAIIGFSCRCAGAADPEALWALVSRAESHIQPIKNADWLDYIDASNADSGKTAEKSFQYGAMKGIDQFDALFFRISAAEAQAMDPAQRILLEECYKALEHAGYSPASLGGRQVGTVIGSMNAAAAGDDHSHHSLLGTETSILSVRIAYFLDLKGPSLTINTSCSSSLVAVDTACEKLRNCSVDLCLAGGIGIYTHPAAFLAMENAGMLSPTGECRPFDAAANGIVVGDGVGVVILKRLRDAIADNDAVYGVIRGSGTNQDGRTSGITVPSFSAQSQLQVSIYKENHIVVEDIQYIEAHGTATRLGDPVEIHGLTHAFKQFTHKTGFCGIGSLKANIGHTGAAAGVLGLIKVLLGLKHRKIPPSINFGKHNSLIDFAQSPVYVNTALTDWPRNAKGSRLAAVNSFGFSGTNAHLVVEEYSAPTKPPLRAPVAIVFSAKTREQLKESARRLLRRLEAGHYGDADLTDMAFTLQTGRDAMAERLGIIADTVESLRLALADFINDRPDSDGLYYGRAAKQDNSGESLTSGGSLSREEYGLLLQQWVKGAALDWHRLYAGVRPGRIGLPTYPFARDSFPLKPVTKASVTRKTPMAASQIQREEAVAEETAGERQAVITAVLIQEKILRKLKKILAGVTQMEPGRLDSHEPLENYGLDSIMINRLNAELEKQFSELPKTLFFEYETLADLVGYLVEVYPDVCKQWAGLAAQTVLTSETGVSVRPQKNEPYIERNFLPAPARESEGDKDGIAVIGISGRFPQANTLEEFWENLKSGKNCITEIPPERWPLQGFYCENSKQAVAQGRSYSKWGGFIEGFAQFDPLFFNILPREAFNLDPQERLFIQCCWELLENAGYTRESLDRQFQGRVGVFAGITKTGFNLYGPPLWQRGEVDIPHTSFGSLANRVSYLFNFRGPSMPVDTLCSASLTAVHEACEHMRRRECELAIAGGVNLYLHPSSYIGLCAQLMLSTDNKCKSFGSGGNGFVPGEGVGAVLLKRLSQARADGDQIVALIKATSINHGGRTSGYTVPNPAAQADVIADALRKADIDPRTVGYIEAHGTGTELGDPIEIAGLSQAFSRVLQVPFPPEMAYQYCAVGSVKSNLGHLEAAAGIAGLIKVILQMRHRQLVPSLHAQSLNPNIDWSKTPFKVQQTLQEWPQPRVEIGGHLQTYPRRAGVSSFGAGGANAHIVVEEYVEPCIQPAALPSVDVLHPALIVLSARTPEQLRIQARQLRDYIQAKKQTDRDLLKIAFTLQVGREAMAERLAFSAVNMPSLIARLTSFIEGEPPGDELYLGRVAQNGKRWSLFCMDEDLQYAMECWMEKGKYEKLLGFWVNGGTFNWRKCYTGKPPERIGLPTYPFATESYWVPAQIRGSVERNHGQEKNGGETLLLIPEWLPEPPPENSRQARADKHWVFLLRDFQRQHLAALSGSLPEWQCEWLQCGEPSLAACYEFYTLELFTRLQAVLRGLKHTALVQVAIGIGDSEELSCLAGLSGLLQTATRENPSLHTQCLLLEALPEPAALAALLRENAADYSRREIRYRRGMREVRQLRFLEHDTGTATPWKDKGVYLITGGMGGLGVIFA
ncbi:MAG: SDR family NAD(P)-dependent oxidoreductase, partial [Exilibacterium sp.]